MDIYEQRDSILKALYEYGGSRVSIDRVVNHVGSDGQKPLYKDFVWLEGMRLVESMRVSGGMVAYSTLTSLGTNFVELNKSTRLLAEQTVNGAIMQQNNHNYGGQPINNMGDHVNISSNVTSGNIAEIVEALRVNGEEGRAVELESAENSHGTQGAIWKVLEWVKEKWINPAALTAVNSVLIAHGIAT